MMPAYPTPPKAKVVVFCRAVSEAACIGVAPLTSQATADKRTPEVFTFISL
jgi:hypothetical protein